MPSVFPQARHAVRDEDKKKNMFWVLERGFILWSCRTLVLNSEHGLLAPASEIIGIRSCTRQRNYWNFARSVGDSCGVIPCAFNVQVVLASGRASRDNRVTIGPLRLRSAATIWTRQIVASTGCVRLIG